MPCRCEEPWESAARDRAILDATTAMLCWLLETLEARGDLDLSGNPTLSRWWNDHKKADEERKARGAEMAARKRARDAALAKLSPDELRTLGLR